MGFGFLAGTQFIYSYIGIMTKFLFSISIILLVILSSCNSRTANESDSSANDSIKKYLDLAGNIDVDFEKRKVYNDIAYSFLDFNRNDSLTRWNLYTIGINNANLTKLNQLKENSKKLSYLALKSNNLSSTADAYKLQGLYAMYISENEEAVEYFYKAKKILLRLNISKRLITLNKDIAQVQFYSNDFLGSNKTLFENLKYIKEVTKKINGDKYQNLNVELYRNYAAIANNFSSLQDHNSAIRFEKRAIEYADNKLIFVNISYSHIAHSHIALRQYDKAKFYLNKIMENPKSRSINPEGFYAQKAALTYLNLIQNKLDGLPAAFYEIDKYYSNNDDSGGQDYNLVNLSRYYIKVNDTLNAIVAAKKALFLSKSYKNPINILFSLKQLIEVDKRNASKNAVEYIRINDSIQLAERRFRDKFARIEYETEEIIKEKQAAIKQKWIVGSVSGLLVLIVMLLLVTTMQRNKQKELRLLQVQQKTNEEIYSLMLTQKSKEDQARNEEKKRIALELHDGVMNRLASTRLNLNALHHKPDYQTIKECLNYIDDIYKIEQEIRNISHDLALENFNSNNSFVNLINDFVASQNNIFKNKYKFEKDASINWEDISANIKINLFRIIQEACHNINKFAQAENAVISLVRDNNNICLSITDNGKGFDIETDKEGIGLKNIKQRVETLNGRFTIQSIKNKSTSLNIAIPFA